MPYTPDVTVHSSDGEPRLLVEVKTREDADERWARRFRRNILAHFPEGRAAYFLLVLPDVLYLWRPGSEPESEPDYRGSTRESLGQYYEYAEADTLGGRAFEFLVTSWLSDLVAFGRGPDGDEEAREWISDSGLYDAIQGGSVKREVAV